LVPTAQRLGRHSAGNSVTELDASTGAKLNVFKKAQFGFDGPARLSDDWTHVWVAQRRRQLGHRTQRHDGCSGAGDKGSTYKLRGY